MLEKKVATMILGGGAGKRLFPLTKYRAKPAAFTDGKYRLIDYPFSNLTHSGFRHIFLLYHSMPTSLIRHTRFWNSIIGYGGFVEPLGVEWKGIKPSEDEHFRHTADAVYKHLSRTKEADYVLILAADHRYKMDYRQFIEYHIKKDADITVGLNPVEKEVAANNLGVAEVNLHDRMIGFEEKSANPKTMRDNPNMSLSSMGIYIFSRDALVEILTEDQDDTHSEHDFGGNIIPNSIGRYNVIGYNYQNNEVLGETELKWSDIGILDVYWATQIEGIKKTIHNPSWPILTINYNLPPALMLNGGGADESLICEGVIIDGAEVYNSVIGPGVKIIGKGVKVVNSVINPFAEIEENVSNAIIDNQAIVKTPIHSGMDFNPTQIMETGVEYDEERKLYRTPQGKIVVEKLWNNPLFDPSLVNGNK